ncbi:MAG: hypothetical protein WB561_03785 [Terracidiphilus sp.]
MLKFLITSLIMFVFAAPALAKPIDVYPVSCNELWRAVKDTLDDPQHYGISSMNDAEQKASFIVIGDLVLYTDTVALTPKAGSCRAKASVIELGADNLEWRQFQHRVARSLAKLQATKPKPA